MSVFSGFMIGQSVKKDQETAQLRESNRELLEALKYLVAMREVKCLHSHPGPDDICAKCKADAAIAKAEAL